MRVDPLSIKDLHGHLRLEQNQPSIDLSPARANLAAKRSSNRGGRSGHPQTFSSSGRGNSSNTNISKNS